MDFGGKIHEVFKIPKELLRSLLEQPTSTHCILYQQTPQTTEQSMVI